MNMGLGTRVRAFMDRLAAEDVNLHGFILSVRGEEKARAYYAPFREGQAHRMYSVSKTMVGLAIGMLAEGPAGYRIFPGPAAGASGRAADAAEDPGYAENGHLLC